MQVRARGFPPYREMNESGLRLLFSFHLVLFGISALPLRLPPSVVCHSGPGQNPFLRLLQPYSVAAYLQRARLTTP